MKIPSKLKIKNIYENYTPYLDKIMDNIKNVLSENIRLSSQPTYKSRIKSFQSYYKKLLRQKPDEAANSDILVCLTDMMGIRVICAFLEDISSVREQLQSLFDVKEVEVKGADQSFSQFGYESVHVLVSIPESCMPENISGLEIPDGLVCEIQIRTILQDAWAEVEHELIYKTEFTPFDLPLRRKLASINASLSLADIIFQEIRDYQKKLQTELTKRRRSFYKMADNFPCISEENKKSGEDSSIERVNPYVAGTIDELLLQAIHSHNEGDLDSAIFIYTKIIESKPKPNNVVLSVIHKHRGMAFFSKNDYENAVSDFHQSFELDNNNFRSIYYEGIVFAIRHQYEKAVECFSRSLSLNEYQSHTFYRRAAAYYELGQYEKSMSDVVSAQKLGLEDAGLKALHEKLVSKFDMKV